MAIGTMYPGRPSGTLDLVVTDLDGNLIRQDVGLSYFDSAALKLGDNPMV